MQEEELKKTFLNILEKDTVFRHAVAGLIGYKELLDRTTKIEDEIKALREETKKIWEEIYFLKEEIKKLWEETRSLREETKKIWEEIHLLKEEIKKLWEETRSLREETKKMWQEIYLLKEEIKKLWEETRSLREETKNLREDHNRLAKEVYELRKDMQRGFELMDKRLRAIEAYIERTSLTLEEEAREVLSYRLKEKGLNISLMPLSLPELEIDIYGTNEDITIFGEVKTRASQKLIESIDNDISILQTKYPQYLKKKIIKVIYTMQALPEAIKEAEKRNIWLVTATKELTELRLS